MSKSDVNCWVSLRGARRGMVTKLYGEIGNFPRLSAIEKSVKTAKLNSLLTELKSLDNDIQTAKFKVEENEQELVEDVTRSDKYIDHIQECLAVLVDRGPVSSPVETARSLLKSPVAPLPKFCSGEGEDLQRFLHSFEETTGRFNYPDHDKFLLLKQQVSGRALKLIDSLDVDRQSYIQAKALLISALASPSTLKFNAIKQISEMKLPYGSDPFEYISKMSNLSESVKNLKIDTDSFLQYFFWSGMNETFRTQFIQITNKTKPSLEEINDHFFDASERYYNITKTFKYRKPGGNTDTRNKESKETSNFAVNVNVASPKFRSCCLCDKDNGQDADHPIHRCQVYGTPKSKVDKLKALGGCLRCAGLTHRSEQCRFRFGRKCVCNQWHFEYLCVGGSVPSTYSKSTSIPAGSDQKPPPKRDSDAKQKDKGTNPKIKETSTNSIYLVDALPNVMDGNSILPTFTCQISGDHQIRVLKDLGCQSNFVTDQLADSQGLKVIHRGVRFKVKGFNSDKEYTTKIVEFEIKVGSKVHSIRAICVPEINISLNLPKLPVITKAFKEKGYTLADQNLSDVQTISNIDLLLGTRSAYCLKHSEVAFSPQVNSIFAETDLGVMLLGDVDAMIEDLPSLPSVVGSSQACSSVVQTLCETEVCKTYVNIVPVDHQGVEVSNNFAILGKEGVLNVKTPDEVSINYAVLDENGNVNEGELKRATAEALEMEGQFYTHYDTHKYEDEYMEVNQRLVEYVLTNTCRNSEGRLILPVLWNPKVCHLLGNNKELSVAILKSTLKKLKKNEKNLGLIDASFREQEKLGIIERIDDLDGFLSEHPEHSFLPHMGVFKLDRETTKCRVVYLSNLFQVDPFKARTISHNMAMYSGPNLNQKISSALLQLRFDNRLLIYDLQKAFNQIALRDVDSNRLLCVWFRNVEGNDFTLVGYRNIRLPFGIRCAPTMLLLGLFKILVIDTQQDDQYLRDLKALLYQCIYMDNGAVTGNSPEDLSRAYSLLDSIFNPYQFHLQQLATNDEVLQKQINVKQGTETPREIKVLGSMWDRIDDTLSTKPICLDSSANTKRGILKSIASQYDIYNFNGPIMNRSRIFMHDLQCCKELGWDDIISEALQQEWKNITKQANASPPIKFPRKIGDRCHPYRLLACSDASKAMYGTVIYIQNLFNNEISFVCAKNRIVNTQLESKTIPSLELQALTLGTQTLNDLFLSLSGPSCVKPINIVDLVVLSDSLVALSWLNASTNKLDKMQKRSVFVMNRISQINKLCETHPVNFSFIAGCSNPGDFITRCVSYKQLVKTNYLTGPDLSGDNVVRNSEFLSFVVPNPHAIAGDPVPVTSDIFVNTSTINCEVVESLIQENRFSSFCRMKRSYAKVLEFVHKLKVKVKKRDPSMFESLVDEDKDFVSEAGLQIIKTAQWLAFPEIFHYFSIQNPVARDIPNLVTQLNIYKDRNDMLRVSSKFERFKEDYKDSYFPLLLPKDSRITELVILDLHAKFAHAGLYTLLNEMKKRFYIPHYFSAVKNVLKNCITCRKLNARSIKVNQSSYREFRVSPSNVPFGYSFLDYMGPFYTKQDKRKTKVWILVITCMWSRAINLKVCIDMSTKEFLRAFQLHSYEYGLPQFCVSDQGTNLVAAGNKITSFLSDSETQQYFSETGIKPLKFEHFFKGHSQLGSLVEVCVKMTKRLIYGSIKNNVLGFREFEFVIAQTVHIVNRRPIAFKEGLRDSTRNDVPIALTPEKLIKGFDLNSINVIPELHKDIDSGDVEWLPKEPRSIILNNYTNLKKVRERLMDLYNQEFLGTLVHQATNVKGRYKPVTHRTLKKGDIVMIKEPLLKPQYYPMGIVRDVQTNDDGEVTGAVVFKGATRELTRRHASVLIPVLSSENYVESKLGTNDSEPSPQTVSKMNVDAARPIRATARDARKKIKQLTADKLV